RIISRGDCKNKKEAMARAEKTNKMRASYYNFYTDKKWGDAETYDLCVNSSILGDKGTADFIVDYVSKVINQ
ncbi:MAG: cytidylate kinase family protein, partial [Bacteroidales bacterium]|nr:cytidylate kinase family protein [Candidatus Physcocola equi]